MDNLKNQIEKRQVTMPSNYLQFIFIIAIGLIQIPSLCMESNNESNISTARIKKFSKENGIADAKNFLKDGKIVLLIPSAPPIEWKFQITFNEYAKFGIEWQLTGDISSDEFEDYRKNFNVIMFDAIDSKYGADFIKKIESKIESKIDAKTRCKRSPS